MAEPSRTERRDMPAGMPMQTRLAPVTSVSAESRTIDLVFTTGAAVRRVRWSWVSESAIPYEEILVVSRQALNLERLNAGAPVLDSHRTWGLDSLRAVVEKAWIDGQEGKATVRFPESGTDEEADRLFRLVQQGIIRNVSCGYTHDKVRIEKPQKEGEIERWYIERWTPHEISFVTIPADPGAQVRGGKGEPAPEYPVEFIRSPSGSANALRRMEMRQRQAGLVR